MTMRFLVFAPLARAASVALLAVVACCSGPETRDQHSSDAALQPTNPAAANHEANKMPQPQNPAESAPGKSTEPVAPADAPDAKPAVATFGGGCFWCTEAVLEQLDGVLDVTSGYMGGDIDNPTYEQICSGTTNHAEVVQVRFDPKRITYEQLLDWFFRSHDPTTPNRQGNDVGTQYRSAIFFHSESQQQVADQLMRRIGSNWRDPIVTDLTPAVTFWPAEAYHQDYFRNNQNQGYCRVIIKPKLDKLGLDAAPKKVQK